jgi:hypothetical protein
MNANPIAANSDMKSNDTRHAKPLFVMVGKFETDSFPVRVRYSPVGANQGAKKPLQEMAASNDGESGKAGGKGR